ncbi:MAG TPA: HNH endonuclease signature motif containing protein, partial [Actinomycetota bacterium]|nr:HNH endonuclease signature motif containing protein [Actinomycetota bacterium]
QAHHIRWWSRGGSTDLENLVTVCSFHHRLVHEHGWAIAPIDGHVEWITADGERHRAGPRAPTPG